jgi:hypothetical protein
MCPLPLRLATAGSTAAKAHFVDGRINQQKGLARFRLRQVYLIAPPAGLQRRVSVLEPIGVFGKETGADKAPALLGQID